MHRCELILHRIVTGAELTVKPVLSQPGVLLSAAGKAGVLISVPEHGGTAIGPPSPPFSVCVLFSRPLHMRRGGTVIGPLLSHLFCIFLHYFVDARL